MGIPSFQFSDIPLRFHIRINFLSLTNDIRSSDYRRISAYLMTHLQVRKIIFLSTILVLEHKSRFALYDFAEIDDFVIFRRASHPNLRACKMFLTFSKMYGADKSSIYDFS